MPLGHNIQKHVNLNGIICLLGNNMELAARGGVLAGLISYPRELLSYSIWKMNEAEKYLYLF